MKKETKIILIVLAVVIISVAGIILLKNKTVKNINSEEFQIHMSTNGGVPYVWKYEISNDNVEFVEKKSENKYPDRAGGPVEEYYIFKAKKTGESIITFKYQSITNDKVEEQSVYKVVIDKDLKINVEKVR